MEALTHDWRIEEREYARQEQRRGRRHAYERLDPRRTALVVVDLVPFFVEEMPYARGMVPRVNAHRDGAARGRRHGRVGAARRGRALRASATSSSAPRSPRCTARPVARGRCASGSGTSSRWPTRTCWSRRRRRARSSPASRRCPDLLQERGVDTVLVTGAVTNVCCESSARDASTLGYRVVMVADANAARRDQDHNATLHTVYRTFGDVRPTEEVLALIAAG